MDDTALESNSYKRILFAIEQIVCDIHVLRTLSRSAYGKNGGEGLENCLKFNKWGY